MDDFRAHCTGCRIGDRPASDPEDRVVLADVVISVCTADMARGAEDFGNPAVTHAVRTHGVRHTLEMFVGHLGPLLGSQVRLAQDLDEMLGRLADSVLFRFRAGQGCPVDPILEAVGFSHWNSPSVKGSGQRPGAKQIGLFPLSGKDLPVAVTPPRITS
nr:hypothetical protein [Pseudodesulfovibrio piezophilus]